MKKFFILAPKIEKLLKRYLYKIPVVILTNTAISITSGIVNFNLPCDPFDEHAIGGSLDRMLACPDKSVGHSTTAPVVSFDLKSLLRELRLIC